MELESIALHYIPEGYSVDGERLMGRRAAEAAFVRALAQERPARLYAYAPQRSFAQHLEGEVRRFGVIDQHRCRRAFRTPGLPNAPRGHAANASNYPSSLSDAQERLAHITLQPACDAP